MGRAGARASLLIFKSAEWDDEEELRLGLGILIYITRVKYNVVDLFIK